jgi:hypothetical protein
MSNSEPQSLGFRSSNYFKERVCSSEVALLAWRPSRTLCCCVGEMKNQLIQTRSRR